MNNQAANSIRQLCSLGLPSHQTIPQILKLIHDYIPSYGNAYFWFDAHQELCDVYDERPEALVLQPTYMEHFHNSYERAVFDGWSDSLKYKQAISTDHLWKVDRKTFFKHDFYGEFLAKLNYHWGLHRPIKTATGYHGVIQLHRSRDESDFTDRDRASLDRIARYLEYSFSASHDSKDCSSYLPVNQGYLASDTHGQLLHYSPGAERLAILAVSDGKTTLSRPDLTAIVKRLVDRLLAMSKGLEVETPSIIMSNKWGKFRLTAFFMNAASTGDARPIINIRIEQFKFSQLVLLANIDNFKLTAKQREVCLGIGLGQQDKEIAVNMGVKISTIISHKKEVFGRMNVGNRHELTRVLLSAG